MIYDTSEALQAMQARTRLEYLINHNATIDLSEKRRTKTIKQNRYLHVALSYFALQIGERLEFCKRRYFKTVVNPDIFVCEKKDKITGERVRWLKSWANISKDEAKTAIDRFLVWASAVAGIYIPSPEDTAFINRMEAEIERNKQYL